MENFYEIVLVNFYEVISFFLQIGKSVQSFLFYRLYNIRMTEPIERRSTSYRRNQAGFLVQKIDHGHTLSVNRVLFTTFCMIF